MGPNVTSLQFSLTITASASILFFFIMEEFEKELSTSQDSIGLFISLKSLKEVQHGDKSRIVKIKTALQTYFISKDLNDDGDACSTHKIHFARTHLR